MIKGTSLESKAVMFVVAKKVKGSLKCPFCQSKRLISRGRVKLKAEIKRKYFCANCNKYTTKPLI